MIDLNAPIVQVIQQITLMDIVKIYLAYVGIAVGIGVTFIVGFRIFLWWKFKR